MAGNRTVRLGCNLGQRMGLATRVTHHETEWDKALPYSKIPAPSVFKMLKNFGPGGEFVTVIFDVEMLYI